VELHQTVAEHLTVDPVVPAAILGQQACDLAGNRADPGL
jgi:hypothetical protein